MALLESILFGIMQGLFEWLPISSTGQLVLVMVEFFGYAIDQARHLSIFLNFGTTLSAILYFRKDVKSILINLVRYKPNYSENNRLTSFLITSTMISGGLGYLLYDLTYEFSFSGEILLGTIGVALIITGIVQKFSKQRGIKTEKNLNLMDSILLGVIQAFSAIPGLSRSGITVSDLLFRGYQAKDSLRLSFLMSIPAILGAQVGIFAINGIPNMEFSDLGIALVTSFVVGYLSINLLLKVASKVKFWLFTIIIGSVALFSFFGLF